MKILALTFILISQSAMARQMFQCSSPDVNSSDVMMINLPTESKGTLFLSSGMENPETERALFKIEFTKIENNLRIYNVLVGSDLGLLSIPVSALGKASDSVNLMVDLPGFGSTEFSCFTRMYE